MNNIKDTLTTIFGLLGAISVALIAIPSLPEWVHTTAIAVSAVSVAIIGYFNGKTADGKTKSDIELMNQKQMENK